MAASILPLLSGLTLLKKNILMQKTKADIQTDGNTLESFVAESKSKDRYDTLKEKFHTKVKPRKKEHNNSIYNFFAGKMGIYF